MDISTLTLAQLKELLNLIPVEIKRREKDEKAKVLKEIETFASERGFSLGDLLGSSAVSPKVKNKGSVAPKYQNPADNNQTWTGRGRQPAWVAAALENGRTLESLLIQ